MIGSLVAVVFWCAFVAVVRIEGRAQRAEWAELDAWDAFRREMSHDRY